MKTILVTTDFSSAALNAAKYAADMAVAINAKILMLHVYQIPVVFTEVPVAVTLEDIQKDAENNIQHLKEIINNKTIGKISIETKITEGVFFQELKNVCERIDPYAVVMGSQGTTASDRLFFGGHTVYASKHLQWPLITVPPKATFSSIKKIGLASDFNKVVDTTPIDEIKILVNDFNAELHVLNTGKKEVYDPEIVFQSGMLQEMLAPLHPQYHFLTNENIDEGIMDFAEKNAIDLLVVIPKRHDLMERLVHKSHTKQLVLHSHVPVLALHH